MPTVALRRSTHKGQEALLGVGPRRHDTVPRVAAVSSGHLAGQGPFGRCLGTSQGTPQPDPQSYTYPPPPIVTR